MSSPINRVACEIPQGTPILKCPPEHPHMARIRPRHRRPLFTQCRKNDRHDENSTGIAAHTSAHSWKKRAPEAYIYIYIRRIPRRIPLFKLLFVGFLLISLAFINILAFYAFPLVFIMLFVDSLRISICFANCAVRCWVLLGPFWARVGAYPAHTLRIAPGSSKRQKHSFLYTNRRILGILCFSLRKCKQKRRPEDPEDAGSNLLIVFNRKLVGNC
jgi:hypothetical protein